MEDVIGRKISDTKGAIVLDTWTHCGPHYFGIFASYMKLSAVQSGLSQTIQENASPLLYVSPISNVRDENGGDDEESMVFDSVTHVRHIEQVFQFFKVDVHD